MKRKINRSEMHDTVVNLLDLGFTAPGIAHMVNRTPAVVYHHLKQAGRMKGRILIRQAPAILNGSTLAAMRKVFHNPECAALPMIALARVSAETTKASVTQTTSKRSGKKAA